MSWSGITGAIRRLSLRLQIAEIESHMKHLRSGGLADTDEDLRPWRYAKQALECKLALAQPSVRRQGGGA